MVKKSEKDKDTKTTLEEGSGTKFAEMVVEGESLKARPINVKLDQLEAQVIALSSLREAYDARFTMLSEKIGEIRSMVLTQAKDNADARAKAERALMALEGVKPEEFRAAIMRRDVEIEGMKAKLTTFEEMIKTLMNEIKDFRNVLTQFKGMETVLGMADDARKNIIRIQQLRDQVELMSDKVMAAFLEFQRRFKDVTDLSLKLATLEETVRPLGKTINQIDVMVKQAVTKAELSKLTGDIDTMKRISAEIKNYHEQVSLEKNTLEKLRADLEKSIKQIDTKNRRELAKINAKVRVIEKIVSQILKLILSTK